MKTAFNVFLAAWALLPSVARGDERTDRPNIVYILADDIGYGDVGCYNPETKLPTPHIDQLAAEGMRFTDAHSAVACTPTRYGILTGRYAWRSNHPYGVLMAYDPPLIEEGRLTVPALLKQQGYLTACIGKWHLGWDWPAKDGKAERDFTGKIPNGPTTRGFDYYFGTHVPNQPPFAFIENDRLTVQPTATFPAKDRSLHVPNAGPMAPGWKFENIVPTHAAKVDEYLRVRGADKKPFFLYYAITIPHEPLAPTAKFAGRSKINRVGDLILEMDGIVGDVMDELKRYGMAENTILIFTGDNGHGPATGVPALLAAGHDPCRPFRGYKGSILEGGHREPFIVRWPGKTKPGSVCDELISLNSLMATCAELLGVTLPADAGEDSFSILPLLLGKKLARQTHETLYVAGGLYGYSARRGPWVYIEGVDPETGKASTKSALFNVEKDPKEEHDVIGQHPDIAKELKASLDKVRASGRSRPE
jgi:arylsulfatase A